jgi:hypothetical protein
MAGNDSILITGRAEFAAAVLGLASTARREIDLLSYDLDRDVYGSIELVDTIKNILLASQRTQMRVLLNQPKRAVLTGHRLIELGRAISSRIEFRELPHERINDNRGELMIVDQRALLEKREQGALYASVWPDNPLLAAMRGEYFEILWSESEPAQELRRLHL